MIHTHTKIVVFLYTNNENSEKEIKKTIFFTIKHTQIYMGLNLIKEVRGLYTEKYKT